MTKWISVLDKQPPIETLLLISGWDDDKPNTSRWVASAYKQLCGKWTSDEFGLFEDVGFYDPTHWMPLPKPPKEQP